MFIASFFFMLGLLMGFGLCGFLYRKFSAQPAPAPAPEPRCHYESCRAWPKVTCGSGHCAYHCHVYCKETCINPLICVHCRKDLKSHVPGKCLFGATSFEPLGDYMKKNQE